MTMCLYMGQDFVHDRFAPVRYRTISHSSFKVDIGYNPRKPSDLIELPFACRPVSLHSHLFMICNLCFIKKIILSKKNY